MPVSLQSGHEIPSHHTIRDLLYTDAMEDDRLAYSTQQGMPLGVAGTRTVQGVTSSGFGGRRSTWWEQITSAMDGHKLSLGNDDISSVIRPLHIFALHRQNGI